MEQSQFPIVGGESRLPVYLVGVGRMTRQNHVQRPDGFPVSQVLLCTRGCGRLVLDGREHRVAPGQGFLLYPEVPHEYAPVEEPWETHWVTFAGRDVAGVLAALGLGRSRFFCLRDASDQDAQWRAMMSEAAGAGFERGYRCSSLVYRFLVSLRGNLTDEPFAQHDRGLRQIAAAADYVDAHFAEPVGLEEMARRAGVSPQYLCRLFRQYLNMRPFEYVAKRRIQQAKRLLLAEDAPVSAVARRCGYESVSYFCAMFRRYEMLTPQQFRSLHRQARAVG